MMNVWTYWEGPRSPDIELCLDTIRQHCLGSAKFHHITADNIDRYIPDGLLHPVWKRIPALGVKRDCVRAAVLAQYGGFYVDADTVMLKSPAGVIDQSKDCVYTVWDKPPARVVAGYVYCRPDSPIARAWLDGINRSLAEGKGGWTDLGETVLTPLVLAADPATVMNVDRRVFLPIDIEADGPRFFTEGAPEEHLIDGSICFGLNHSWMAHHRGEVMGLAPERTAQSTPLIHRLLNGARHSLRPIKIAVCCCTYRRPQLLGHLIHCFEAQDYPHREMIILDDAGELEPATGPGWRIVSVKDRAKSLGAKRNRLASMISTDADAIVPWDDDDLAMPWALSAVAAALRRADWARPSLVLVRRGDAFQPVKTSWREDGSDKAYHPSWGYTVAAFKAVGGYPEDVSVGEDLGLALKFRAAGFSEADPIAVGYEPYYAFGPWDNEHLSYAVEDYTRWPQRVPPTGGHVHVGPAPFSMARESIRGPVLARPWSGDWWENSMA